MNREDITVYAGTVACGKLSTLYQCENEYIPGSEISGRHVAKCD